MGNYGFYTKHHYLGDGDRYPGDALIDAANEAIDLRAEVDRMRAAVVTALAELDEEHQPQWSSDEAAAKGKAPIGCTRCWPGDGHWPCSSRLIADDLRAALSGSSGGEG